MARKPKETAGKEQGARERILASAEELFANKGMHGASLREIARSAGINVNLISYYFTKKEDLYDTVVDTRAALLNDIRAVSLDALEDQYSPEPVPVEKIIESLVHPFFAFRAEDPTGWDRWIRLLEREAGTDLHARAMTRNLSVVLRRYLNCLHRAIPTADRDDLMLVLELATRAMVLRAQRGVTMFQPDHGDDGLNHVELEERVVQMMASAARSFAKPA